MKLNAIGLFTACALMLSACNTHNIDSAKNTLAASKTSSTNFDTLKANDVTLENVNFKGVPAIKVEMTEAIQKGILTGAGNGNGSTFALTGALFDNGVIEGDVAGENNGKGAPDARGFVGIAHHISEDLTTYEAIYLRMSNGTQNNPPPPAPRPAAPPPIRAAPRSRSTATRRTGNVDVIDPPAPPASAARAPKAARGRRTHDAADAKRIGDGLV